MNNLLDTLAVSCFIYTSKVEILLNMNNLLVPTIFNPLVGTSETIRLLNKDINLNSYPFCK